MKKKNKKNHIKMRFSTLLLCILAIVLYAAPCDGALLSLSFTKDGVECNGEPCDKVYCNEDGEYDVTKELIDTVWGEGELLDVLEIGAGATVNLDTDVSQYVYAGRGSVLNIYSGNVDWHIAISNDEPYAVVTVYGTDFAVSADKSHWVSEDQVVIHGTGELTGTYGNDDSINLKFLCPSNEDVPIQLKAPASKPASKEVEIDIKPGSNTNSINLKSKGVVPVAVLTTDGFNAVNVVPNSVTFAGAAPVRWTTEDVDNDGKDDMLFHFKTENLELDENSTEATLTGMMTSTITNTTTCEPADGQEIRGTDEVCIKSGKKKK